MPEIRPEDDAIPDEESLESMIKNSSSITPHRAYGSPLSPDDLPHTNEPILRIYSALQEHAVPRKVPSQRLNFEHGNIWLVDNGNIEVFRKYDDLKLWVASGPLVVGMLELFSPFGRHYVRISAKSTLMAIPAEKARDIIERQQLWCDVAKALTHYCRVMSYRDEHLISRKSYTSIRVKLLEFASRKEMHIRQKINIVSYIHQTTFLSRSLIYSIISDLEKGGYIRITNGKLEIVYLPENY